MLPEVRIDEAIVPRLKGQLPGFRIEARGSIERDLFPNW